MYFAESIDSEYVEFCFIEFRGIFIIHSGINHFEIYHSGKNNYVKYQNSIFENSVDDISRKLSRELKRPETSISCSDDIEIIPTDFAPGAIFEFPYIFIILN